MPRMRSEVIVVSTRVLRGRTWGPMQGVSIVELRKSCFGDLSCGATQFEGECIMHDPILYTIHCITIFLYDTNLDAYLAQGVFCPQVAKRCLW